MGRAGRAWARCGVIGAIVMTVAAMFAPVSIAGAQIGTSVTTYRVDVEAQEVVVEAVFDASLVAGGVELYVPAGATGVEASIDGVALPVQAVPSGSPDDFWQFFQLDVASNATGIGTVTYRMPTDAPRTAGWTRVNRAHLEFIVSPDPSFGRQDVVVELPVGFRADLGADYSLFEPGIATDGSQRWRASSVDPWEFLVFFTARNESGLVRNDVAVGSRTVEVAAWADDPEWQSFANEYVAEGIPVLVDLIGSSWPEDDLVVIESTAPYNAGAAGWFSYFESEIEVGDDLDDAVMLHELTHAWFNGITLDETWLIEGFAEFFAAQALEEMTGELTEPTDPADGPAIGALADWAFVSLGDPTVFEYYNTSWHVMNELHTEVGDEGMAAIAQALLDGDAAYGGRGSAATRPANDWRRMLDVAEQIAGSTTANDLFVEYVVDAEAARLLDVRAEVREQYVELQAASLPYDAPLAVRNRMADWKFQEAELLIADAALVVAELHRARERADALDISLPVELVDAYELEGFSFDQLEREVDAAHQALDVIEAGASDGQDLTAATRRFERGLFSSIADDDGALAADFDPDPDDGLPMPFLIGGAVGLVLFLGFMGMAIRAAGRGGSH